jgi:translation elongation factor EF-4
VAKEIETLLWTPYDQILAVSGKTWQNVDKLLDLIVEKVASPKG